MSVVPCRALGLGRGDDRRHLPWVAPPQPPAKPLQRPRHIAKPAHYTARALEAVAQIVLARDVSTQSGTRSSAPCRSSPGVAVGGWGCVREISTFAMGVALLLSVVGFHVSVSNIPPIGLSYVRVGVCMFCCSKPKFAPNAM